MNKIKIGKNIKTHSYIKNITNSSLIENKNPCTVPIEENKLYLHKHSQNKKGYTGATGPSNIIDLTNIPTNSILFKDISGNINGSSNLIFDPSDVGGLGKITFPGVLDPLAVVFSPTISNPVVGPNAPYTIWTNSNTNNFMINESEILTTSKLIGPTGPTGFTGPNGLNNVFGPTGVYGLTGATGPSFNSPLIIGGDILNIFDNLSTIDLSTQSTIINNYIITGLNVFLGIPNTNNNENILKTIKLSKGSFSTNIITEYGTIILNSGDIVQLLYINSYWNIIKNTGIIVPISQFGNKLVGSGGIGSFQGQGSSVSLSNDGLTLAVGGPSDNGTMGATWIFVKDNNGLYIQQGEKLIGSNASETSIQGYSVSLSGDGNTLAVGGRNDVPTGAIWIFTRSEGVWTQQGPKLIGTGNIGFASQGFSISLSKDGNTVATGGYNDNNNLGAVWIFTRINNIWSQQGPKLVGSGFNGFNSLQGYSVSLSSDGNIVAIGGPGDNNSIGATWIFTRSNNIWTQQSTKLVGSGNISFSYQGQSVSLSSNGETIAIGGPLDNNDIGATWIFTRSNNIWTQQGNKLIGSGGLGQTKQGKTVSLSSDGNILAISGFNNDNNQEEQSGATWIFTKTNNIWTQIGEKLIGSGTIGNSQQSSSNSLSGNGNILAIGGLGDNNFIGATWIFA